MWRARPIDLPDTIYEYHQLEVVAVLYLLSTISIAFIIVVKIVLSTTKWCDDIPALTSSPPAYFVRTFYQNTRYLVVYDSTRLLSLLVVVIYYCSVPLSWLTSFVFVFSMPVCGARRTNDSSA